MIIVAGDVMKKLISLYKNTIWVLSQFFCLHATFSKTYECILSI